LLPLAGVIHRLGFANRRLRKSEKAATKKQLENSVASALSCFNLVMPSSNRGDNKMLFLCLLKAVVSQRPFNYTYRPVGKQ
jgi:hypothetical protein